MKVILNSDVMRHENALVVGELMRPLRTPFAACRAGRHDVVIPLTSRYEFDHHQVEMVPKVRTQLADAYKLLDKYGVTYTPLDPAMLKVPDLIDKIRKTGVSVTELHPIIEDYNDAHRRAALHLSPRSPDGKSDEMRDLVIWAQALRVARENRGALLIANDKLLRNPEDDAEANSVGLVRVATVEEALEHLEVRSAAGRLFESLLTAAWPDLVAQQPKLPRDLALRSAADLHFVQGETGIESAKGTIRATVQGNQVMTARATIRLKDNVITEGRLEALRLASDPELTEVIARPQRQWSEDAADVEANLAMLREVLKS